MRIAIPLVTGGLSPHFGRCEEFALVDADLESKSIAGKQVIPAPDHQPGLLPRWLHQQGATLIIAGGMGRRAQDLFAQHQIEVVLADTVGETPEALAQAYLSGNLQAGENICEH